MYELLDRRTWPATLIGAYADQRQALHAVAAVYSQKGAAVASDLTLERRTHSGQTTEVASGEALVRLAIVLGHLGKQAG